MQDSQDFRIITFDIIKDLLPNAVSAGGDLAFVDRLNFKLNKTIMLSDDLAVTCFIRKGEQTFVVNGKKYNVKKGEILALQAADWIEISNINEGCEGCVFFASIHRMIELLKEVNLYRLFYFLRYHPVLTLDHKYLNRIEMYLCLLSEKMPESEHNTLAARACDHIMHGLVAEIFSAITFMHDEMNISSFGRSEAIYRNFLTELATLKIHPREVKWYADRLCISPKYLSEVCRRQGGRSASEWIKEYAILDIRTMMQNTQLSIKEIAHTLGYPNLPFFGKCVHRWFGMSPTQLRIKFRGS